MSSCGSCGGCRPVTRQFNHGDSITLALIVRDIEGSVADIEDLTVTGELYARNRKVLDLHTGAGGGITIENTFPPTELELDEQQPHGTVNISKAQAMALPEGRTSFLRLVFTLGDEVASTRAFYLDKRMP